MRKVALHSLGCKVNAYETDAMSQLFLQAGYETVPFEEKADVYVINTCTVTNMADRKSRQMLHRAKKQNPEAVVVAAGCYVQADSERAAKDASVDLIVGNDQKNRIVELVERLLENRSPRKEPGTEAANKAVIDINGSRAYEPLSISETAEHTRAYVKVQDGCNQFCTYCLIPYVRGRVRSRAPEEVEREVAALAQKGYREVVLTGIHLTSYGTDLNGQTDLLGLLMKIHHISGIDRIRLGSLEPTVITEPFAKALSGMEKLCPHFHLSLQSGCDTVLERMNRHYTTARYREACGFLREYFDRPAITTDVIAGFPGETEEEFEHTCRFLEETGLSSAHIFKYSRRKGTRADRMPDQVPEKVKAARSDRLLKLSRRLLESYQAEYTGRQAEILFEEQIQIGGESCWVGHTREYIRAAARSEENLANAIRQAVLDKPLEGDLMQCRIVRK